MKTHSNLRSLFLSIMTKGTHKTKCTFGNQVEKDHDPYFFFHFTFIYWIVLEHVWQQFQLHTKHALIFLYHILPDKPFCDEATRYFTSMPWLILCYSCGSPKPQPWAKPIRDLIHLPRNGIMTKPAPKMLNNYFNWFVIHSKLGYLFSKTDVTHHRIWM